MGEATVEQRVKEATDELRELMKMDLARERPSINNFNLNGSAAGYLVASFALCVLSLGAAAIIGGFYLAANQRIGDLVARIEADRIELSMYKIRNDERAATDRLVQGTLKDRLSKLESKP